VVSWEGLGLGCCIELMWGYRFFVSLSVLVTQSIYVFVWADDLDVWDQRQGLSRVRPIVDSPWRWPSLTVADLEIYSIYSMVGIESYSAF
jgi:hypothetical protein